MLKCTGKICTLLLALTTTLVVTQAARAKEPTGTEVLQARALITSTERATLSAELAARVVQLPHRAGDRFAKGELLVGLDCALYLAQLAKVKAENRAAKARHQNATRLNTLRSIGAMDVVMAKYAWEQSEAELDIARLNAGRCEIRAPFNGRVVAVEINLHEYVRSQEPVIEIVADRLLEVEVVVPSVWMHWLQDGQGFQIRMDGTGTTVTAEVVAVNPAIDPVSQTVTLRARLKDAEGLTPGMSATAFFEQPRPQKAVAGYNR